jgi:gas vesicle protein
MPHSVDAPDGDTSAVRPPGKEVSARVDETVALVDTALAATAAYDRDDLAPRLRAARERLTDPVLRVLVVGEFKQGKSSLVNAVLNTDVCPVDDDVATSVPTLLRFAEEPTATAWHEADGGGRPVAEAVPVDRLADHVSEVGNPDNERRLRLVEVGLPRRLLQQGLSLVDTPGVGGLGSAHGAVTVAALPTAEAVLLVTDASQELTAPELRFLGRARELCPTVTVALTKTDLYPEWRNVADLDRDHLDEQGFGEVAVLPVSSSLRRHALRTRDAAVNEESGFDRLVGYLRDEVLGAGERLSVRAAANAVQSTAHRLGERLTSEREALADPRSVDRVRDELERARAGAERLRSESARWQTTLTDGVADLNADIDHDLRGRTRRVIEEAEARIEDGDPGDWWEELETWLAQRVAEEVVDNYTLLARRAEELAHTVAEHFAAAEDEVEVGVGVEAPLAMLADLGTPHAELPAVPTTVRGKVAGSASRGLTAVRGSYGGYMMVNMVGGMLGLGALSPALLGATLLMGGKTLRDEKQRQLTQRRQEARTAVRKYVDEVSFQIGKDSRDALRRVQRQLRDGFAERAEQVQRGVAERLEAAQRAAQASEAERQQRLRDVEAELARVDALAQRALRLAPDLASREAGR